MNERDRTYAYHAVLIVRADNRKQADDYIRRQLYDETYHGMEGIPDECAAIKSWIELDMTVCFRSNTGVLEYDYAEDTYGSCPPWEAYNDEWFDICPVQEVL